jgi:hypothetical protein
MLKWNEDDVLVRAVDQIIPTPQLTRNKNTCGWCHLLAFLWRPGLDVHWIRQLEFTPSRERHIGIQESQLYQVKRVSEAEVLDFDYVGVQSFPGRRRSEDEIYLGSIAAIPASDTGHPLLTEDGMEIPIDKNMIDCKASAQSLNLCKHKGCFELVGEKPRYTTSINITLVDVEQMCLVDATTENKYFCLSYVWGNARRLKGTSKTRKQMRKVNALKSPDLAGLIQDGILLVLQNGFHIIVRRLTQGVLGMFRLCSGSAQACSGSAPACSPSAQVCSPSAQVKAAVTHVRRLKRNQRKGKLILSLGVFRASFNIDQA